MQHTVITDDYCGSSDTNQPIGGTLPVATQAALRFPATRGTRATAITVPSSVTEEYTVAFVGTSDGSVLKVSLESISDVRVYETVHVQPGEVIKQDMLLDEDEQHLYVMTENRVSKMRVQDCDRYSTACADCHGARDPYCGWCLWQNKCSVRIECDGAGLPKVWLPYHEKCPHVTTVQPDEIQRDSSHLLSFFIENAPVLQQQEATYRCVFSPAQHDDSGATGVLLPDTPVTRSNASTLQCPSLDSQFLPTSQEHSEYIVMRLSVALAIEQHEVVIPGPNVIFFDCRQHSTCTKCTSSRFACYWCVHEHRCTHQVETTCSVDVIIAGKNSTGNSTTAGPEHCPRIEALDQQTDILVPAKTSLPVTVQALGLLSFQKTDLWCDFKLDTGRLVPASVVSFRPNKDMINCEPVVFDYYQNTSVHISPIEIVWGKEHHPLDNPDGIQVLMYKCSPKGGNCGECLTQDPKYQCVWCDDERCSTREACLSSWLPRSGVCPNPTIVEVCVSITSIAYCHLLRLTS